MVQMFEGHPSHSPNPMTYFVKTRYSTQVQTATTALGAAAILFSGAAIAAPTGPCMPETGPFRNSMSASPTSAGPATDLELMRTHSDFGTMARFPYFRDR